MKSGKTGVTFSFAHYATILYASLVFRKKDLCDAKHDVGVENFVSKNLFWDETDWWMF